MSHDRREAIAEVLAEHEPFGGYFCTCTPPDDEGVRDALPTSWEQHLAEALLGSDVMAQIRAEARADALRPVEALLAGYEAWTGADPFDEFASSPKQRAQLRAALDAGGSA